MATEMEVHTIEYSGAIEKFDNMERCPKIITKISNLKDDSSFL